jgi:hypothetical protein
LNLKKKFLNRDFFKKNQKNREFTEIIKNKPRIKIYRDFRKKNRDLGKLPRIPITDINLDREWPDQIRLIGKFHSYRNRVRFAKELIKILFSLKLVFFLIFEA